MTKNEPIYVKFIGSVDSTKKLEDKSKWLGTISGYASTNDLDRHGDIIIGDVLKKGEKALAENTTVFFNHEHKEKPIGKVLNTEFRQNGDFSGLYIDVGISKTANEIWTLIEEGVLNRFSIGMFVKDYDVKETEDDAVFLITDAEIVEVSVVGLPANPNASIESFGKMLYKAFEPIKEERLKNMNEDLKTEFEEKISEVKSSVEEIKNETKSVFSRIEELLQKKEETPYTGERGAPLTPSDKKDGISVSNEDEELKLGLALLGKYIVDRRRLKRPISIEIRG